MARFPFVQRIGDTGVRLLYVVGALAMVWVLQERHEDVREESLRAGGLEGTIPEWLLYIAAGLLVGVMLGLALRPATARLRGYRWGVALVVGGGPLALLILGYLFRAGLYVPDERVPTVVFEQQDIFAVMLGVAITAGLTARKPE